MISAKKAKELAKVIRSTNKNAGFLEDCILEEIYNGSKNFTEIANLTKQEISNLLEAGYTVEKIRDYGTETEADWKVSW